jgi:hypothetical protein
LSHGKCGGTVVSEDRELMLRLADFLQESQRVESLKEFNESCLHRWRRRSRRQ